MPGIKIISGAAVTDRKASVAELQKVANQHCRSHTYDDSNQNNEKRIRQKNSHSRVGGCSLAHNI